MLRLQMLYEPAVEKFSRYLVFLEQERKYLSRECKENNAELLSAMSDAVEQLNSEQRCANISLGPYQVKLSVVTPEQTNQATVKDHDVPVLTVKLDLAKSDLTIQQVI